MPLTPFHLGPSSCIGLALFRFLNLGAFLVASVISDVEPFFVLLFNLNYPIHGFLHTFLGGTIVAIVISWPLYHLRGLMNKIMSELKLSQESSFKTILVSCIAGVNFHVLLDAFLYTDMKPFFPFDANPFYGLVSFVSMYLFCTVCFAIGGLLYIIKLRTRS